jgi:two-component system CheB/CheR fusion protein
MIRNLLSNAVKYTKRGRILVGCRRRGDKLRIEVCDTGIGIPDGQLDAIFEEFHQLDNPARERSLGLGLGLSIAQRLGTLLRHDMDVRSRPGVGSIFAVEVPLGRHDTAPPPEASRQPATAPGRPSAILVVEDDPTVREMLDILLTEEGHHTAVAADGREALAIVARGAMRPDLVVADYNLPGGITGLEVVAELRKTLGRSIPAVILTGDISTATLRDIAQRDCIQRNKPVKAAELTGLIERLVVDARQPIPESEAPPRSPNGDGRRATVFIVDDDRAVREAMRGLLEQEGRLVEVYPSAKEFLEAHRPGRTGCLVVDSSMPGMTGIELLERLRAEQHDLPAIMVTAFGDVRLAVRAMQAGAAGFIEKPVRPEELLAAVDGVLARSHDSAALAAWREEMAKRVASLTRSQRRVMDLVLEGNPNKKIAAVLGISQRTVENHRAAVMKKIRAASLSQLIHLTLAASQHDASSVR